MEYRLLGKTGRKVSRLGFGGATAGLKNYLQAYDPAQKDDREGVIRAIKKALELGVNYFDTAADYGNGASEEIYAQGLSGVPEEEIFLATKVAPCDADAARRSLERSMKRLGRERIDLIQIHGTAYTQEHGDLILKKGGMLEALQKARDEGLVKYIGFTVECQNRQLYRLMETDAFDVMQIQYNFMFQHPYDPQWKSGSLFDAQEHKMGIVSMRTATSGMFQNWMHIVDPDNTKDYTEQLIQFVLSNPLVDVALVGMRDEKTVEQNVRICEDLSGRIDLSRVHLHFLP